MDREALGAQPLELVVGRPARHQVAGGEHHPGARRVAPEHRDRLARLHHQRLVVAERAQARDDGVVGGPVPGGLAGAPVDDEVLGTLAVRDGVLEHPQDAFLAPAVAAQGIPRVRPNLVLHGLLVRGACRGALRQAFSIPASRYGATIRNPPLGRSSPTAGAGRASASPAVAMIPRRHRPRSHAGARAGEALLAAGAVNPTCTIQALALYVGDSAGLTIIAAGQEPPHLLAHK